ncbi:expressed unknown protein [Seminavis robusta]|uniref:Uncharacterized protein n=1 Tax=Seminavis robusta TaxID=568900 RepID=A0A9N8E2Q5_9STRA|nr:expressed unknown protein [Seminavis robusta]|eukprot:Sro589_g171760.1 n/a (138) ;mRNA; f:32801-33214
MAHCSSFDGPPVSQVASAQDVQQCTRRSGHRAPPVAEGCMRMSLGEEEDTSTGSQELEIPLGYSPAIPLTDMLPLMRLPHLRRPPAAMPPHRVPFATHADIVAAIDQVLAVVGDAQAEMFNQDQAQETRRAPSSARP